MQDVENLRVFITKKYGEPELVILEGKSQQVVCILF